MLLSLTHRHIHSHWSHHHLQPFVISNKSVKWKLKHLQKFCTLLMQIKLHTIVVAGSPSFSFSFLFFSLHQHLISIISNHTAKFKAKTFHTTHPLCNTLMFNTLSSSFISFTVYFHSYFTT